MSVPTKGWQPAGAVPAPGGLLALPAVKLAQSFLLQVIQAFLFIKHLTHTAALVSPADNLTQQGRHRKHLQTIAKKDPFFG
jgi:hypothetical protein